MTEERMYVLSVDTLEEYALAINQHLFVLIDAHIAETIFCGEYHLLLAVGFLLHDDSVEIRILGAPWLQVGELSKADIDTFGLCLFVHIDSSRLCGNSLAVTVNKRNLYLLACLLARGVVYGETDRHGATCVSIVEF